MSNLQPPDNSDKNNKSRPQTNVTLVCDKCGAENWNLASVGLSHDQQANEVKGYGDCDGVWRFPRDQSETEATERRRQFRIVKGQYGQSA